MLERQIVYKKSKPFSCTSGFTIQKRIRQALGNSLKD